MANAEDKKRSFKDKRQPAKEAALSVNRAKKLPELLAPAGEAAAVYSALAAGADAVYLGASHFSARAYAQNLTDDELIQALDHAHLFGRKIYLACNILLRASEFDILKNIMDPLYEHCLDGVIVQDLGVLRFLRKRYKDLPLHGSTQMSINSVSGALQLKKMGISRLVPGRELSLEEIRMLKETGLELECFVHGAMCYSYSGRCLLSSMAGGRSGNRGRCAGPCRQPYSLNGSEKAYFLSMKDMMALERLPELIEAGVDSLKIEGRMKAPEYSAGVSAVYRKYMDMYACGKAINIDKADLKMLEGLYMRSDRQEGYLHKHNGRDMISIDDPAYSKVSEEEKERIRNAYTEHPLKKEVNAFVYVNAGKETLLSLSCEEAEVTVAGAKAEEAVKRSISDDEIKKQITKTGDTDFVVGHIDIANDGHSFIPVSLLNDLRRNAVSALRDVLAQKRLPADGEVPELSEKIKSNTLPQIIVGFSGPADISVAAEGDIIGGIILELDAFLKQPDEYMNAAGDKKLYLRLPEINRQKDAGRLSKKLKQLQGYDISGLYCPGLDALGAAAAVCNEKTELKGDRGLYVFNPYAEKELETRISSYTVSEEFSAHDIKNAIRKDVAELIIYGRTPLMYSANCAVKTKSGCDRTASWQLLKDEKHHAFPLRPVHEYCYNVLYNCLPTSLHKQIYDIYNGSGLKALRIEFTNESRELQSRVINAFAALIKGEDTVFPLENGEYTYGHYKRGAE